MHHVEIVQWLALRVHHGSMYNNNFLQFVEDQSLAFDCIEAFCQPGNQLCWMLDLPKYVTGRARY